MNDLIEALQIFKKYLDGYLFSYPTNCDYGVLRVIANPEKVTAEDKERLKNLGFDVDEELECFYSDKFGSN